MADPPAYPDRGDDIDEGPNGGSTTSTPRWVLALGIGIAIALVLLLVVLHLTGTLGPSEH